MCCRSMEGLRTFKRNLVGRETLFRDYAGNIVAVEGAHYCGAFQIKFHQWNKLLSFKESARLHLGNVLVLYKDNFHRPFLSRACSWHPSE